MAIEVSRMSSILVAAGNNVVKEDFVRNEEEALFWDKMVSSWEIARGMGVGLEPVSDFPDID